MRNVAAAAVAAVLVVACGTGDEVTTITPVELEQLAAEPCQEVIYYVDGSASGASVTYANATGGTEQLGSIRVGAKSGLPIGCVDPGGFLYVSAQNSGASGSISCRIVAGKTVVAKSSSSGAYAIATCDGVVP